MVEKWRRQMRMVKQTGDRQKDSISKETAGDHYTPLRAGIRLGRGWYLSKSRNQGNLAGSRTMSGAAL